VSNKQAARKLGEEIERLKMVFRQITDGDYKSGRTGAPKAVPSEAGEGCSQEGLTTSDEGHWQASWSSNQGGKY
jgi:hypothetical protein